jgi:hypothetical protein
MSLLALLAGAAVVSIQSASPGTALPEPQQIASQPQQIASRGDEPLDLRVGTVRGQVLSADTGDPLADAIVSLLNGRERIDAMTDSSGHYLLTDVPVGAHRVRASHLGHAPLEVVIAVPPAGRMIVDFSLTVRPVELAPVTAESETGAWASVRATAGDSSNLGSDVSAAVRVLDATPGVAEMGLMSAQSTPEPDAPGAGDILYVRGGTAYLDYALLDGAPVQVPYHLGGLVEPLIPGAIAFVQQFRGGAPARYDGGISGLTAIDTRSASAGRFGATGHLDMMSTGGSVEAATDDGIGLLVAGRTIHGAWTGAFVEAFPQDYTDALARADLPVGTEGALSATVFYNRERLDLGFAGTSRDEASWGNKAGSLRFMGRTPLGDAAIVAAFGEFSSRLPIGGSPAILATGSIKRTRFTADLTRPLGTVRLNYGLAAERIRYQTRFDDYTFSGAPEAVSAAESDGVIRIGGIRVPTLRRATGQTAAGYVESDWRVSSDLSLLTGMRLNYFTEGSDVHLSPRAALGWRATDDVAVSLSVGRYSQYVTVPDSQSVVTGAVLTGSDGSALASSFTRLSVASSTHVLIGLGHDVGPRLSYRLEGNWKRLTGIPGATEPIESAGLQFALMRSAPGFGLWGSYEMGWDWTASQRLNDNFFAGRHLLRGGISTALAHRFTFDADVAFGSGLSYGAIPRTPLDSDGFGSEGAAGTETPLAPSTPVDQRLVEIPFATEQVQGSYLRLNLKAGALWNFRVSGRAVTLRPYVKLINALDRRDGLFYHFDPLLNGQLRAVGTVPAMPIIGFDFAF